MGTTMWGRYTKISKLGEGGMGEVWLVFDEDDRVLRAAKRMHYGMVRAKDTKRFEREIHTLMELRHDNIVMVSDYSCDPHSLGYVMEYCPAGSLEDYAGRKNIDISSTMTQLASAVSYLHEQGFVHRDIKPQNLLVAPTGQIRLSDFGLVVESVEGREIVTTSNWISPGFSPPEQHRNMASTSCPGDVYSCGALLYNLLTRRLFNSFKPLQLQIHGIRGAYVYLLQHTLATDPTDRWQSARYISDYFTCAAESQLLEYLDEDESGRRRFLQEAHDRCYAKVSLGDVSLLEEAVESVGKLLDWEDDAGVRLFGTELVEKMQFTINDTYGDWNF